MADEIDEIIEAVDELDEAIGQHPEGIVRDDIDVDSVDSELATRNSEYIKPWERQPEENGYQWALFEHFRDSGVTRTVAATVRWFDERGGFEGKKSLTSDAVYKISRLHNWSERVVPYDDAEERKYQIARSKAVREMVERHSDQIEEALDGLSAPVKALQRRMENDPEFLDKLAESSPAKLITLVNSTSRTIPALMSAERLARDMPTEIVGGTVEHRNVVKVEVNHIGQVLAVLESAGVLDDGSGAIGPGEVVDAEVVEVHPLPAESDDE